MLNKPKVGEVWKYECRKQVIWQFNKLYWTDWFPCSKEWAIKCQLEATIEVRSIYCGFKE